METPENINDLRNQVRFVTLGGAPAQGSPVPDSELSARLEEALGGDDPDDLDLESLDCLGASTLTIGGVALPPPTLATMMLLQTVESPFASPQGRAPELADIYEFLYVCSRRGAALDTVARSRLASRQIRKSEALAAKAPEFYAKYLDAEIRLAESELSFRREVLDFAEGVGHFDVSEAAEAIDAYLDACVAGFEMLPAGGEDKKKAATTRNG